MRGRAVAYLASRPRRRNPGRPLGQPCLSKVPAEGMRGFRFRCAPRRVGARSWTARTIPAAWRTPAGRDGRQADAPRAMQAAPPDRKGVSAIGFRHRTELGGCHMRSACPTSKRRRRRALRGGACRPGGLCALTSDERRELERLVRRHRTGQALVSGVPASYCEPRRGWRTRRSWRTPAATPHGRQVAAARRLAAARRAVRRTPPGRPSSDRRRRDRRRDRSDAGGDAAGRHPLEPALDGSGGRLTPRRRSIASGRRSACSRIAARP